MATNLKLCCPCGRLLRRVSEPEEMLVARRARYADFPAFRGLTCVSIQSLREVERSSCKEASQEGPWGTTTETLVSCLTRCVMRGSLSHQIVELSDIAPIMITPCDPR
jgi:hypothetical protein